MPSDRRERDVTSSDRPTSSTSLPRQTHDDEPFDCCARLGCIYVGDVLDPTPRDEIGDYCRQSGECCYHGDDLRDKTSERT